MSDTSIVSIVISLVALFISLVSVFIMLGIVLYCPTEKEALEDKIDPYEKYRNHEGLLSKSAGKFRKVNKEYE
jgi:uncharacterized protein HemY